MHWRFDWKEFANLENSDIWKFKIKFQKFGICPAQNLKCEPRCETGARMEMHADGATTLRIPGLAGVGRSPAFIPPCRTKRPGRNRTRGRRRTAAPKDPLGTPQRRKALNTRVRRPTGRPVMIAEATRVIGLCGMTARRTIGRGRCAQLAVTAGRRTRRRGGGTTSMSARALRTVL